VGVDASVMVAMTGTELLRGWRMSLVSNEWTTVSVYGYVEKERVVYRSVEQHENTKVVENVYPSISST
jgi:hypothetical protein